MKKLLLVGLVLFGQTSAFAEEKEATHLVCGNPSHSVPLNIQFGGGRYADWIRIGLDQDIKSFLNAEELDIDTTSEALTAAVTMGTCKRGSGDILLTCAFDNTKQKEHTFEMASFNFSFSKKIGEKWHENTSINRNLQINKMDLKVIKNGDMARLDLDMNVDLPHKDNVNVKIERKLATLNHDWYMCKFINRGI